MKCMSKILLPLAALLWMGTAQAGNPQRVGSAGAPELLINPWARSTGWGSVNLAGVSGIDATYLNIAGITSTDNLDVGFTNTQWLIGAGITINSAALTKTVGSNGVLSGSITSFNYGEFIRTNEQNPEGGIGTVSPNTSIIRAGYAQKFTESIRGGVNIKLYSTNIVDMRVTTAVVDAGVQYVAGDEDQVKFGFTLRNVGPSAQYRGDGQSVTLPVPQGGYAQAFNERSAAFEVPATLGIGASYDFNFSDQQLTLAGSFISNSFETDRYTAGAQYSLKNFLQLRAGYTFFNTQGQVESNNVFSGLSAGMSLDVPLGEDKDKSFTLDYSYQTTKAFDGVHSIGVTVKI
ncbi:MAG: PorV/PorQ family protein [Schleiferiaceae bacterium]|nr:PorV/PorQ family protein [Schleiferiaceae bacterium]